MKRKEPDFNISDVSDSVIKQFLTYVVAKKTNTSLLAWLKTPLDPADQEYLNSHYDRRCKR